MTVDTYRLDEQGNYRATGSHHDHLRLNDPFPITVDFACLDDYLL